MLVRKSIVAALALLVAWLAVRTAIVGQTANIAPAVARSVAPGDPAALIAAANYPNGDLKPPTAEEAALLDRAVRRNPLYYEPFLANAAFAAAHGEHRRAERLGEAARARDPRVVATHLLLLTEYARSGDLRAAVAEMTPLAAISGVAGPALAAALTTISRTPQGERVVEAALRTNPRWRSAFVRQPAGSSEGLAFRTLAAAPRGVPQAQNDDDRTSFLMRLVQAGDYQRAYLAWVNFLPASQSQTGAIYDGSFAKLPGLQPFNWTLTSNELGTAERRSDSALPGGTALDVNFFGGGETTLATETLFVQPGNYTFSLNGVADGGGKFAGALHWQLTCLPSGATTPLVTVSEFSGRPFQASQPVTIPPSGCAAQQLSLTGEPGEVSTLLHAQFNGLRLVAR